jgi:DNA repair exonuclease SbcCD ATPase subunit
MRLHSFHVKNFGSYSNLRFTYANGCTLVTGPTGSGKSTLFDIPCWILFGITAKNGSVEDIRSWNTKSEQATMGELSFDINGEDMWVTRTRGKSFDNDLFYRFSDGVIRRGKDMSDTQRLINEKLNMTSEIYCAGSYYSEFSPSSSFFTAKAKDRRELLETIAPLQMAIKLTEGITSERKVSKTFVEDYTNKLAGAKGKLLCIEKYTEYAQEQYNKWHDKHSKTLEEDSARQLRWSTERNERIEEYQYLYEEWNLGVLSTITELGFRLAQLQADKCKVCGRSDHSEDEITIRTEIEKQKTKVNPYKIKIETARTEDNPFEKLIAEEENKVNPWIEQMTKLKKDYEAETQNHASLLSAKDNVSEHLVALEQLSEVVDEFRARLLTQAIDSIQTTTNDYLTRFFDSEISVEFQLKGSDALDVTITKDANVCNYKQLSKGQRQLLKLTFSLAVMKELGTRSGTKFGTIFLDESLDGMDAELKVKAFNLFSELETEYNSVMVIDHSQELKTLFTNQLNVRLENEWSLLGQS